jgi:predicted GIY-YIG superfamily endonuclease
MDAITIKTKLEEARENLRITEEYYAREEENPKNIFEMYMEWRKSNPIDYQSKNKEVGCIYILKDSGNNALKIGFTTDLGAREKQHRTSNPFLTFVSSFPNMTQKTEKIIHDTLHKYRIKNTKEWYKNSPEVIKTVKSMCKPLNNEMETEKSPLPEDLRRDLK